MRVHFRFLRSTSPVDRPTLPEVLETAAQVAAAQRNDGVGTVDRPMHAGTLEPSADGGLATGLNDTRTHSKSLGTEVRVLHPVAIAPDILGALPYLLTLGGSAPQAGDIGSLNLAKYS